MGKGEIFNYYESLVFGEIDKTLANGDKTYTRDTISDIACVALNQLPSRYIRYNIDLALYMEFDEKIQTEKDVAVSVKKAFETVSSKPRLHTQGFGR